jgi:predicted RNA-binding protein with PIN domain
MQYRYLIDGNNLIGAIPELNNIRSGKPQQAREELVFKLSRYFHDRKEKVTLFLDGFEKEKIASGTVKIKYSNARPADTDIRTAIELEKNRRCLIVVTSDRAIMDFAGRCSCAVKSSAAFRQEMEAVKTVNEEEKRITGLASSNQEFVELFTRKNRK